MKLLCCSTCSEVFSLSFELKECKGGHCGGKYVSNVRVEYYGPETTTFVLGFANGSLIAALRDQLSLGDRTPEMLPGYGLTSPGREFTAFVIPQTAPSVFRTTKELIG